MKYVWLAIRTIGIGIGGLLVTPFWRGQKRIRSAINRQSMASQLVLVAVIAVVFGAGAGWLGANFETEWVTERAEWFTRDAKTQLPPTPTPSIPLVPAPAPR